jgi:hypothetical protein
MVREKTRQKPAKSRMRFTNPREINRGALKHIGAHADREDLGVRILELAADRFAIQSRLLGAFPLNPSPQTRLRLVSLYVPVSCFLE